MQNGYGLSLSQGNMIVNQPPKQLDQASIQQGIRKINDWIKGPGNKLLASQNTIPRNLEEAEKLRKAHEQFEFKCTECIGFYAELAELPRRESAEDALYTLDIEVQEFLQRLHQRRAIVVSSYTFFRLLNELWEKIKVLLELCSEDMKMNDVNTENFEKSVAKQLDQLQQLTKAALVKKDSLRHERQRLRVLLGERLPQHMEDAVRKVWTEMTNVEQVGSLRQLEWRKEAQLGQCRAEAERTISWLAGLGIVLNNSYRDNCVGKTPVETMELLLEQDKLQRKAEEAYQFTERLLNALRLMCQSEKRSPRIAEELNSQLQSAWQSFQLLQKELRERREVAETVYKHVDSILSRVESLLLSLANAIDQQNSIKNPSSSSSTLNSAISTPRNSFMQRNSSVGANTLDAQKLWNELIQKHSQEREEIIDDYEETSKIASALMQRLSVTLDQQKNPTSEHNNEVESTRAIIRMKLYTLWIKIVELDNHLGKRNTPKDGKSRTLPQVTPTANDHDIDTTMRSTIDKFLECMGMYEKRWRFGKLPHSLPECNTLLQQHVDCSRDIKQQWNHVQSLLLPMVASRPQAKELLSQTEARLQQWQNNWHTHQQHLEGRHAILQKLDSWDKEIQRPRATALNQSLQVVVWDNNASVEEYGSQVKKWLNDLPVLDRRSDDMLNEIRTHSRAIGDDEFMNEASVMSMGENWRSYKRKLQTLHQLFQEASTIHQLKLKSLSLNEKTNPGEWKEIQSQLASVNEIKLKQLAREVYSNEEPIMPLLKQLHLSPISANKSYLSPSPQHKTFSETSGTPSLQHKTFNETLTTVSPQHKTFSQMSGSPSSQHKSFNEMVNTPSPQHKSFSQGSGTPSLQHKTSNESLATPSPQHKTFSQMSGSPSSQQKTFNEMLNAPSPQHKSFSQASGTPSSQHKTFSQTSGTPSSQRKTFNEMLGTPSPQHRTSSQTSGSPSSQRKSLTTESPIKVVEQHNVSAQRSPSRKLPLAPENEKEQFMQPRNSLIAKAPSGRRGKRYDSDVSSDEEEVFVPQFNKHLSPVHTTPGSKITLHCRLGSPIDNLQKRPIITWTWEGVLLSPENMEPAGIQTFCQNSGECYLHIPHVTKEHAGLYSCTVTNTQGQLASTSAAIIVEEVPNLRLLKPVANPGDVAIGSELHLCAEFEGYPPPSISWYKDNDIITADGNRIQITTQEMESHLRIKPVQASDGGYYAVEIQNSCGSDGSVVCVNVPVGKKPSFAIGKGLEDQQASEGDRVFLRAELSEPIQSFNDVKVQWYKDNVAITPKSHPKYQTGVLGSELRLVIPEASKEDTGVYSVVVENEAGRVENVAQLLVESEESMQEHDILTIQEAVTVRQAPTSSTQESQRTSLVFSNTVVRSPPEFLQLFTDEICAPGDAVIFTAQIAGLPKPAVWWSYNGQFLTPESERGTRCEFQETEEGNAIRYSLVLHRITEADAGRYSLTAENSTGLATCSSLLLVIPINMESSGPGSGGNTLRNLQPPSGANSRYNTLSGQGSALTARAPPSVLSVSTSRPLTPVGAVAQVGSLPGPLSPHTHLSYASFTTANEPATHIVQVTSRLEPENWQKVPIAPPKENEKETISQHFSQNRLDGRLLNTAPFIDISPWLDMEMASPSPIENAKNVTTFRMECNPPISGNYAGYPKNNLFDNNHQISNNLIHVYDNMPNDDDLDNKAFMRHGTSTSDGISVSNPSSRPRVTYSINDNLDSKRYSVVESSEYDSH